MTRETISHPEPGYKSVDTWRFDSWDEWVDYVDKTSTTMREANRSSRADYGAGWHGTTNWGQAVQLAKRGWEDGAETVRKLADPLFNTIVSKVELPEIVYDVEGAGIDIPSYVNGEPECWTRWEDDPQSMIEASYGHKFITFVVNSTVSGGVSSEVIIARGAAICALVNLLEFTGRRCRILLSQTNNPSRGPKGDGEAADLEVIVTLKEFEQPLDLSRVVFGIAHPAAFRRLFFSFEEVMPESWRMGHGIGGSYGNVTETPRANRGDVYASGMYLLDTQWSSPEAAQEWILKELKKYGVAIAETV